MSLFFLCEIVNIKDHPNSSTNRIALIKCISGNILIHLPWNHSFFSKILYMMWLKIFWIIYSVILGVVIAFNLYCRLFNQIVYWDFRKVRFMIVLLWKRGDLFFCTCRSVCRPSLVRSISFNPFDWELQQCLSLKSNFQVTQSKVKLLFFKHMFFWPLRLRVFKHKVVDPK